jgi:hypothetical protein
MRRAGLLALVALAGCHFDWSKITPNSGPPEPPPTAEQLALESRQLSWRVYSQDRRAWLTQTWLAHDHCKLESGGAGEHWSEDICTVGSDWLRFLSPDAEELIAIAPRPPLTGKYQLQFVPVTTVYRRGIEHESKMAINFMRAGPLELVDGGLAWLSREPEYTDAGVIDGVTVDGQPVHFTFTPPPPKPVKVYCEYTWGNEEKSGETTSCALSTVEERLDKCEAFAKRRGHPGACRCTAEPSEVAAHCH